MVKNNVLDAECISEKKKWISITGLCNNNCKFCLDSGRKDSFHKNVEEIKKQIKKAREEGNTKLILSGGDPTIHPNIIDFVSYAKEIGYAKIQVITNGRMFASKKFTSDIIKAGLDEVTFSIHGFSSEMHDSLTGVEGSFKQIMMGVKNVFANPKKIIVNTDTCITKSNYLNIPKIIKFIVEKVGITEVNLMSMVPQGNAWTHKDEIMVNPELVAPYVHQTIDYCTSKHVVLWLSRFPAEYLERYEEFIQDPYKMVDDVRGMAEHVFTEYNEPSCKGEKCNYCGINPICSRIVEIAKKHAAEEKPTEHNTKSNEIIITSSNYKNIMQEIRKTSENGNVPVVALAEPSMKVDGTRKLLPRMIDIIPYLEEASKKHKFKLKHIPKCIFENAEIEKDSPVLKSQYYIDGNLDFVKIAEDLAKTAKSKIQSCKKCLHYHECEGVFTQYLRAYGSKDLLNGKIEKNLEDFKKIANRLEKHHIERIFDVYPTKEKLYTEIELKNYWKILAREISEKKKPELLNFYVHIPFCRSKCAYCMFPSRKLKDEKEAEDYVNFLLENIDFYKNIFSGFEFKNIYIGGGTASILTYEQINRLLTKIFEEFKFYKGGERNYECNPDSITFEKMKLLRKFGFNRISFGVQSTNENVLAACKRGYQKWENVVSAITNAHATGFTEINVDLILGLKNQTKDMVLQSFEKIAKLNPHSIIVYAIDVGNLKKEKLDYFTDSDPEKFLKNVEVMKEECMVPIEEIATKQGYFCMHKLEKYDSLWIFSKPEEHLVDRHSAFEKTQVLGDEYSHEMINVKSKYNIDPKKIINNFIEIEDHIREVNYEYDHPMPFSCFAMGWHARMHIYGLLDCINTTNDFRLNPSTKCWKGFELTREYEMLRHILKDLKEDSVISQFLFKKRFGESIFNKFGYALASLKKLGKIDIKGDSISLLSYNYKDRFIHILFFAREITNLKMEDAFSKIK